VTDEVVMRHSVAATDVIRVRHKYPARPHRLAAMRKTAQWMLRKSQRNFSLNTKCDMFDSSLDAAFFVLWLDMLREWDEIVA
jgi:hypothetical protein